jgi:hypothetical protein
MPDVDSILVQHGIAWEIWRDTPKDKLPPLHPDLAAQIHEAPAGTVNTGDAFDGEIFTSAPSAQPEA